MKNTLLRLIIISNIVVISLSIICSCQELGIGIKGSITRTQEKPVTSLIPDSNNTLTLMNWNIQSFGKTKWGKPDVKQEILRIIPKADIIFIQEIRDKSGEAFKELCRELNQTHKCNISSRAGRTSYKEQYGIIYRKEIQLLDIQDYNPDSGDRWERPPVKTIFKTIFNHTGYILTAYNIHTKPRNATIEIKRLEEFVTGKTENNMKNNTEKNKTSTQNIAVLGDLNADCYYYNAEQEEDFAAPEWKWVIQNQDDTTTSSYSDCAYDRIIINQDASQEYLRYGIYMNITGETSDHYPVWVEIKPQKTKPLGIASQ